MAKEKKIKGGRLVKAYDPELEYATNLEKAIAVSLLFFIVLFLSVKHMEIKPVKTKHETTMKVEEIDLKTDIVEPPPPPKTVKPKLPPQVEVSENAEEGVEADTIISQIATATQEFAPPPPPQEDSVYNIATVEVPPKLIKTVRPEYPEMARKAGLTGKVIVEMIVGKDGHVESARVLKSDNEIFNEAALKAVKQYVFEPAKQNDRPVRVKVIQVIRFTLEE